MDFEAIAQNFEALKSNDHDSDNWVKLFIMDSLLGSNPMTKDELTKVLKLFAELEPDKVYTNDEMRLMYKFFGKINSINAKRPQEYDFMRSVSAQDENKARILIEKSLEFRRIADNIKDEVLLYCGDSYEDNIKHTAQIVFKKYGYTGKPTILKDSDFMALSSENVKTIYRGFKTRDEIEAFKSGDFFISHFWTGNGVYFTDNYNYARQYAPSDDLIISAKVDFSNLQLETNNIIHEAMHQDLKSYDLGDRFYDVGIYGAIKGIDVISRIESGFVTYLILNRTKVYLSDI